MQHSAQVKLPVRWQQHNAGTQRDLHLCGGGGGKMAELSLSDTQSQRKRFPQLSKKKKLHLLARSAI